MFIIHTTNPCVASLYGVRRPCGHGCVIDGFAKCHCKQAFCLMVKYTQQILALQVFTAFAVRAGTACVIDGFAKCHCKQAFCLMVKYTQQIFALQIFTAFSVRAGTACVIGGFAKCHCKQAFFFMVIMRMAVILFYSQQKQKERVIWQNIR